MPPIVLKRRAALDIAVRDAVIGKENQGQLVAVVEDLSAKSKCDMVTGMVAGTTEHDGKLHGENFEGLIKNAGGGSPPA